ncbi:MAG: polymer-forming cytoskeletal protein [Verrucomicrobiales bacterium]|nr:polymer-forming cytoskeletal protein [Verrucomicrobiales bacterium]
MKEQGMYRQQYFKDAVCFECEHHFKVGRSTKTTNCPQCGAAICMEDVEVNMNSTQPIQTRGDVIIRKRGHVSTSRIDCKDLRCYGIIEANVHCTGEALFKTEGTIIGEVRCKRLIIEKGASVEFANTVFAEEMEINASATGDLHSSGRILILPYGSVNGDVTARAVSIEPGGELNGGMHIIRQAPPSGPLPSMD